MEDQNEVIKRIAQALKEVQTVEEIFRKIQENPARYVAENDGFTARELEQLEKAIALCGETAIAANEISRRTLGF
jgi:ribosomal protein L10